MSWQRTCAIAQPWAVGGCATSVLTAYPHVSSGEFGRGRKRWGG